ncbi:MAG: DEAD/DEAH box helicase family protein [Kiritimatiellae bacterium]|nr:DEAD/DEAH box helicase family protein [Kiritimatiellia bacterium]
MELKDFQLDAIVKLNDAMDKSGVRDIVLKSPTGSGKTIILTQFMSGYMKDHPDTLFVWLTPGQGELQEQSKAKMEQYCHNASTKNLADVMTGGFSAGDAVFINWQKLTMKGNLAMKDSERTNFVEWIDKARNESGLKFKIVIDESHQNFSEKADAVVNLFHTDKIVRASATPLNNPGAETIEVTEDDVIAAGLIKKMIEINPDFPQGQTLNKDSDEFEPLLEMAVKKRTELAGAFAAAGSNVNPLIVVQLPNNDDSMLGAVEAWFGQHHIDCATGTLAVWLANRKDNIEGISDNAAKPEAIIIKQAIATGWDCPRAHILVKLRKNMGETFEIQTIGRIRRMPEGEHYGVDVLDHCYLYTFDETFKTGLCAKLVDHAFDATKLFLKEEHKAFSLTKEQRTMVAETRDPKVALKAVGEYIVQKNSLCKDQSKNRVRLETHGYTFSDKILLNVVSGSVATLLGMEQAKLNAVSYGMDINTHKHGRAFHHVVAEIGRVCSLPYNDTRTIVFRLFGENPACSEKIVAMSPKLLYAFVINNEHRLKEDFREAMSAELHLTTNVGNVSEKEFKIPSEWICTYDSKLKNQSTGAKNVYNGYLMSARPRSTGEVKFEKWCESEGSAEWWYRNGDKGEEYFSIVYADNTKHQKLFYPDYILSIGGKVWIVEVKGNFNKSGTSENIDLFAPMKADALKSYCLKRNLRAAFVCYDEEEDMLVASTDGFSENKSDKCWRPITSLLEEY